MMGLAEAFFFFRMMGLAEAESCVDEVGFFFFWMVKMGSAKAEEESCVEVGFFLDQKRSGIFH